MLKDAKHEILHFSVNTTQVPCCTPSVLTSLYFGKNTVSIAKTCNLPLTQSFGAQLVCLDSHCLSSLSPPLSHSANSDRHARLQAIHAISMKAIEEDRSRRNTLLEIRSIYTDDRKILSSIQYRDLLNLNLEIFSQSSCDPLPDAPSQSSAPKPSPPCTVLPTVSETSPLSPDRSLARSPLSSEMSTSPIYSPEARSPSGVSDRKDVVVVRRRAPSTYVDPSHDNFKQRFATMRQISLSYGGDSCSTKDLSLELPHQKEKKGKQRLLTALEKEILSREGSPKGRLPL